MVNTSSYNEQLNKFFDLSQKLFCTFTTPDKLDETIETIIRKYSVLHDKIFILDSPQSEELMLTYNIDTAISSNNNIPGTILLHRKKDYNTLYTINALNAVIKEKNNGILDTKFIIDWSEFQNSIILTSGPKPRILETNVFKIVELSTN